MTKKDFLRIRIRFLVSKISQILPYRFEHMVGSNWESNQNNSWIQLVLQLKHISWTHHCKRNILKIDKKKGFLTDLDSASCQPSFTCYRFGVTLPVWTHGLIQLGIQLKHESDPIRNPIKNTGWIQVLSESQPRFRFRSLY